MKERSFDEMIAYFNRRVSEMDIAQDYKMELLGMVTALGYKHEKTAQQWIPCSERTPEKAYGQYWVCTDTGYQCQCRWTDDVYGLGSSGEWAWKIFDIPQYSHVVAWMPLPEPYREERTEE